MTLIVGLRFVRAFLILLLIAAFLPLAACGKKGPPEPPPDQPKTYPRTYPHE
jgi:predicted small lipoprotein YifL